MNNQFDQTTSNLIKKKFELEIGDEPLTEEEMLMALAERVAWLMEYRLEFLMSSLYRLDVLEIHLNEALSPDSEDPPYIAIAKLIIDREKQRNYTKKKYKQDKLDDEYGDLAL